MLFLNQGYHEMKTFNERIEHAPLRDCYNCGLYSNCLDSVIVDFSLADQKRFTQKVIQVRYKEVLVRQGQLQKTLYIVRSGVFKASRMLRSGREKVARFYFPGDIIGLAAFNTQSFLYSIESCQPNSSVCQLHLEDFFNFFDQYSKFRAYILQLLSSQLREHLEEDSFISAEARLARFFLFTEKKLRQKQCHQAFDISLPRKDIANHLGMAVETLSRILTRWAHLEIIKIISRKIIIQNPKNLVKLAELDVEQRGYEA